MAHLITAYVRCRPISQRLLHRPSGHFCSVHMHRCTGSLIFMVCSITYHYKYLLWFTLLSWSFSLSLSLADSGGTGHCSHQWNHSGFCFFCFFLPVFQGMCLLLFLIYILSICYCCFPSFSVFTIKFLMLFRWHIDSCTFPLWLPPSTIGLHQWGFGCLRR